MADFYVTPLLSDGAVLQREEKILVRGGGRAGTTVTAELSGEPPHLGRQKTFRNHTKVGAEGVWRLTFEPLPAGGPYCLSCTAEGRTTVIKDIWIGDVWILAGQSNMQLPMERVKYRFPEEYRDGALPLVRQFLVPVEGDFDSPRRELTGGTWEKAVGKATASFSAVGFFFGRKLFKRYQVPVGLILTAVGGTPIQAWMSREALADFPEEIHRYELCRKPGYMEEIQRQEEKTLRDWWKKLDEKDPGIQAGWRDGHMSGCAPVKSLENIPELSEPGTIWLKRQIDIPPERAGMPVRVSLGTIVDADFFYVNGKLAGSTGYRYPPREYELEGLLPGKNMFVLRVAAMHGQGGFTRGKQHRILWEDGFSVDISSGWEFRRGAVSDPLAGQTFPERKPVGMYQGMTAPLQDFPVKGICWYQGEMNTDEYERYPGYFKRLAADWRKRWKKPGLPILFVQLPNYDLEDAGNWVNFREMQRRLTEISDTAMVVTINCGEANDLHPTDKKTVGERLAMAAFQVVYGEEGGWLSPLPACGEKRGRFLKLYFSHAEEGLKTSDGKEPAGFEYLYGDGTVKMARVRIEGKCVIAEIPDTVEKTPLALVYGWNRDPASANICSGRGLPVSPFWYGFREN